MARVRVVNQVRIGRRTYDVKKVPALAPLVVRSTVEATVEQLRVLAEEARELIQDRIFGQTPQEPGQAVLARPRVFRASNIPTITRTPARLTRLARRTVLFKARARRPRLDGRKLLATGDYIARGIEVYRGEQPSGGGVYFMVRPAQRPHVPGPHGAHSKPINLSLLAKVHEFGSAAHRIPARPVWGPSVRTLVQLMRRMRPSIRAEALRRAARQVR
jgi:hypothetical protein